MQILKGDKLKSITVESILKSTNSYCYVYYDTVLSFNNYHVNSKYNTLEQFQGYLQYFIDWKDPEKYYDYFIIYTNNKEKELSEFIQWLDGKEGEFNCRCILVTCR